MRYSTFMTYVVHGCIKLPYSPLLPPELGGGKLVSKLFGKIFKR